MGSEVTDSTFETEVLQADKPVLVDFWAEWCGPCHAVEPVLKRIAEEHDLKLVKVNIDENQDLAMRYGIQSIPNMMLFEGGAPKASAVGAMPKGMLERQLGFSSCKRGGPPPRPPPKAPPGGRQPEGRPGAPAGFRKRKERGSSAALYYSVV